MKILVVNSGSSSLKYKVINEPRPDEEGERQVLGGGLIERIGLSEGRIVHKVGEEKYILSREIPDHERAISCLFEVLLSPEHALLDSLSELACVGHRVVHGGEHYDRSVVVDNDTLSAIEACIALAPLHNPANLAGIMAIKTLLPDLPQVAVFDTAFHQTMAPSTFLYGLPYEFYTEEKIRKYGFHGSSHAYITNRFSRLTNIQAPNLIVCHLGNGASLCAVAGGKSVDTSMGFTPLDGLLMGTRAGTLDPAVVLRLLDQGRTPIQVDRLLNKGSGVLGVSGLSSDMREIEENCGTHEGARRALDLFCERVRHYLGAYMLKTGPLDGVAFTGGVGENSSVVRAKVLKDLEHLGFYVDSERNKEMRRGKDPMFRTRELLLLLFLSPTLPLGCKERRAPGGGAEAPLKVTLEELANICQDGNLKACEHLCFKMEKQKGCVVLCQRGHLSGCAKRDTLQAGQKPTKPPDTPPSPPSFWPYVKGGPASLVGLRRACAQGNVVACNRVARFVSLTKEEQAEARVLHQGLRELCDARHLAACAVLGEEALSGRYGHLPPSAAPPLLRRTCDRDPGMAGCFTLAGLMETGYLLPKNTQSARALYQRLCKEQQQGEACFRLGRLRALEAPGKGDNPQAQRALRRACRYGHEPSCALVDCFRLLKRKRVLSMRPSPSLPTLHQYYDTLCTAGNRLGCHQKALDLFYGRGIRPKARIAKLHLKRLCESGYVRSCMGLGRIYLNGYWGSKPERKTAAHVLQVGCERGSALACGERAEALGERDPESAALRIRACSGGHLDSCIVLAMRSSTGANQRTQAWQRACQGGAIQACVRQAFGVLQERGPGGAGLEILEVGCAMGYSRACAGVAQCALGVKERRGRARRLARRSCLCGLGVGCLVAGRLFSLPTNSAPRQSHLALTYYTSACQKGLPDGCLEQAKLLMGGRGVEVDLPKAKRILALTCRRYKHEPSCALLGRKKR